MTLDEKKIEFAIFCIECVAKKMDELPEDIYLRLQKQGLIENYLIKYYDTLHTQGKQYIVEEVMEALRDREEKGDALW